MLAATLQSGLLLAAMGSLALTVKPGLLARVSGRNRCPIGYCYPVLFGVTPGVKLLRKTRGVVHRASF